MLGHVVGFLERGKSACCIAGCLLNPGKCFGVKPIKRMLLCQGLETFQHPVEEKVGPCQVELVVEKFATLDDVGLALEQFELSIESLFGAAVLDQDG